MKGKMPPSRDVVSALVSVGFIAGEETPATIVLSDGTYTVNVPKVTASVKETVQIRDMLDEIFSYYALEVSALTDDQDSEAFDENLKRIAHWASGNNGNS